MKKRLLSIVFALLMLCQLLSFSILAEPAYDEDNETPGIGWENVYDVTLPEAPVGYTITVAEGSSTTVEEGGSFSFTVEVLDGYNGDAMVVAANGETLTATEGVYTITVNEAVEITVEGVEEEVAEGLRGDANNDGVVDAKDATRVLLYVAGKIDSFAGNADANGAGEVNAKDATRILLYVAGKITLENM